MKICLRLILSILTRKAHAYAHLAARKYCLLGVSRAESCSSINSTIYCRVRIAGQTADILVSMNFLLLRTWNTCKLSGNSEVSVEEGINQQPNRAFIRVIIIITRDHARRNKWICWKISKKIVASSVATIVFPKPSLAHTNTDTHRSDFHSSKTVNMVEHGSKRTYNGALARRNDVSRTSHPRVAEHTRIYDGSQIRASGYEMLDARLFRVDNTARCLAGACIRGKHAFREGECAKKRSSVWLF